MSISLTTRTSTKMVVEVDDLDDEQRTRLQRLIEEAVERVLRPHAEVVLEGWTAALLEDALSRLAHGGSAVQADAIRHAIAHDGYVSRDKVYEIGRYSPNRSLRGFTRPVNRIQTEMKEKGLLPTDAVNLLDSSYEHGAQADGFRSPAMLVALLRGE